MLELAALVRKNHAHNKLVERIAYVWKKLLNIKYYIRVLQVKEWNPFQIIANFARAYAAKYHKTNFVQKNEVLWNRTSHYSKFVHTHDRDLQFNKERSFKVPKVFFL